MVNPVFAVKLGNFCNQDEIRMKNDCLEIDKLDNKQKRRVCCSGAGIAIKSDLTDIILIVRPK